MLEFQFRTKGVIILTYYNISMEGICHVHLCQRSVPPISGIYKVSVLNINLRGGRKIVNFSMNPAFTIAIKHTLVQ